MRVPEDSYLVRTQSTINAFRSSLVTPAKPAPAGQTILIVDDEESIRTLVHRVLSEAGYKISVASDGPQAIDIASRLDPLDLLVTDLMMPQMNGDELGRRLRLLRPALKVLYLTGFSDQLFKEKVTLWEDEAYLDKPCSIKGLREAVSLLLSGSVGARNSEL
jgi:DNA-binding response OmpR family regulator